MVLILLPSSSPLLQQQLLLLLILLILLLVVTDPGRQAGKLDPLAGRKTGRVTTASLKVRGRRRWIEQKLLTLLKLVLLVELLKLLLLGWRKDARCW